MKRNLVVIYILIMISLLQACSHPSNSEANLAENGTLDLTEWQHEDTAVELNGQWEFYWNQLLEPEDFNSNSSIEMTDYMYMPSNWYNYDFQEEPLPKDGYATYRLNVNLKEHHDILSLHLPNMFSNYKLWINRTLVAQSGIVGTSKQNTVPKKETKVVHFSPNGKNFTITLQISNYHDYAGGMWEPIVMGNQQIIQKNYLHSVILQSVLLGILLLSGLYHIGLSYFRKSESYFFYFGASCLAMATHYFLSGNILFTKIFPNINWELVMKMEYISLYINLPLLSMFLYRLFPQESSKLFTKFAIAISSLYTILTLVTNAKVYTHFLTLFHIPLFIGVIYALIVVVRVVLHRREGGIYALIGIFGLMTMIVVDMTRFLFNYNDLYLYPFGVFIFVICLSFSLSKRLSTSLDLSQELSIDLKYLNEQLEEKVEERTEQILQSNRKLEKLNSRLKNMALIDGLTQIPNRRQFDSLAVREFEKCRESNEPFSLIFIDIDNFKLYNDHYGHQRGDECLRNVADTLDQTASYFPDAFTARYGGEEFVCILPKYDQKQAIMIAEKMRHRVQRLQIPHAKSTGSTVVTVSLGLATVLPSEEMTLEACMNLADQALYDAKEKGKNQVIYYPQSIDQKEKDFPKQ
ncbi:diguanylate cyclase (GGDEF)-like protein [Gracilibacillus halotolerans]|uniref:Diguanylate cyclase (GGDEF)-like protein n=1 Tax=Gracilibacillus halotolerans TaxID=74386 RepID=A0A841RHY9_9BACI|nr:diguanylate cyclase [Gracilibacillus halotolerans]MBB6512099.1 diguanylate cyclase (GGDEF)-like protein [Gracilibacillus halotolerans]